MKTVRLNDAASIPAVGFGTYLISNDEAKAAVSTAISVGYRHIDTAEAYGNEEGVGLGLQDGIRRTGLSRADIFVTTKLWPGFPQRGIPAKSAAETIRDFGISLQKLGLDYLDLYLIHAPFGGELRCEQWQALTELRASGKVRAIGVSNFNPTHIDELRQAGLPTPDANQIELHPWCQRPDFIAYLAEHDIAPIAYSSLAPLSTWRVKPGQDSAKSDRMRAEQSEFAGLASRYGVSEAQLLLRWAVQKGFAVLPKSLDERRMKENIDLFSFELEEEEMATIAAMDRGQPIAWAIGDPSK